MKYNKQQIIKVLAMDSNLRIKVRVQGKCVVMALKEEEQIENAVQFLKVNGLLDRNAKEEQLQIWNSWTREQLHFKIKVGKIKANERTGFIEIQIVNKQRLECQAIQNFGYDESSQKIFKTACESALNNDEETLLKLYRTNQISHHLIILLLKIKQKLKSGGISSQAQKQCERLKQKLKLQDERLNSQLVENKENEKKSSVKIDQLERLIKENEAKLAAKNQELDTLKLYLVKIGEQDSFTEIKEDPKLSSESIKAINELNLKLSNKITGIANKYEKMIADDKEILEQSIKESKKSLLSLLYKSKTFQLAAFKPYLVQYSQSLREFIEDYTRNTIVEVQSEFYMDGSSSSSFVKKLKGKANVILLFSAGERLFGIFSIDAFGSKTRSQSGFLFSLTNLKTYEPKEKQPIWKHSSVELRIGNQALIMPEPIAKDAQLKLRKKKPLQDTFVITEKQINQMLGGQNQIAITSFECLTILFQNENSESRTWMTESMYLKTEESV